MNIYLKTDMTTVLKRFSIGNQIQCRIENSIYTFDFTKNNSTVVLNSKMIQYGEWYVLT